MGLRVHPDQSIAQPGWVQLQELACVGEDALHFAQVQELHNQPFPPPGVHCLPQQQAPGQDDPANPRRSLGRQEQEASLGRRLLRLPASAEPIAHQLGSAAGCQA